MSQDYSSVSSSTFCLTLRKPRSSLPFSSFNVEFLPPPLNIEVCLKLLFSTLFCFEDVLLPRTPHSTYAPLLPAPITGCPRGPFQPLPCAQPFPQVQEQTLRRRLAPPFSHFGNSVPKNLFSTTSPPLHFSRFSAWVFDLDLFVYSPSLHNPFFLGPSLPWTLRVSYLDWSCGRICRGSGLDLDLVFFFVTVLCWLHLCSI